jgi:uncharacterized protein
MDPDFAAVEVVEHPAEPRPNYWGLWATVGFSLLVAAIYCVVNTVIAVGFMIAYAASNPNFDPHTAGASLQYNGLLLAIGTIGSAPFVVGPIALLAYLRRGASVRQYLALEPVSLCTLLGWLAATGLFIAAEETLSFITGNDAVSEFMREAWRTAGWLPLLWVAVIIFAPLGEETFFRGFLFVGLRNSVLGNVGAVLITSAIWAAIHIQYDLYHIGLIFVLGILLGIARICSGSLYVPIAMHALVSLAATIGMSFAMQ